MNKINLSNMNTEQRNSNTTNIDEFSTLDIVKTINNEDKLVALAVEKELHKISKSVDLIYSQINQGGRLIYIGAGTSGRLGVLDASECPPTYGVSQELVIGIIAGGDKAFRQAQEGTEDSLTLAKSDLKKLNFNKKDVLVGIAASGRTPYVIGGLKYAKSIGAKTISLCNSVVNKLSTFSDVIIIPQVGAEVIAGSTRMKAGTSQKLVLNMLTTAVMIKLGKVFGNLMVDVQPSNQKLIQRQINIVMQATGCSTEEATKTLKQSKQDSKLAIFMILSSLNYNKAKQILEQKQGKLKQALQEI